jgi:hypothetical protein
MSTEVSTIVLTGGASAYGEFILPIIKRQIMSYSWNSEFIGKIDIRVSASCDDDVIFGMAYVVSRIIAENQFYKQMAVGDL